MHLIAKTHIFHVKNEKFEINKLTIPHENFIKTLYEPFHVSATLSTDLHKLLRYIDISLSLYTVISYTDIDLFSPQVINYYINNWVNITKSCQLSKNAWHLPCIKFSFQRIILQTKNPQRQLMKSYKFPPILWG